MLPDAVADSFFMLVSSGFKEQEILDFTLDKYFLYCGASIRKQKDNRRIYIRDTAAAIAGVLSKEGVSGQLKALED